MHHKVLLTGCEMFIRTACERIFIRKESHKNSVFLIGPSGVVARLPGEHSRNGNLNDQLHHWPHAER